MTILGFIIGMLLGLCASVGVVIFIVFLLSEKHEERKYPFPPKK